MTTITKPRARALERKSTVFSLLSHFVLVSSEFRLTAMLVCALLFLYIENILLASRYTERTVLVSKLAVVIERDSMPACIQCTRA